MRKQVIKRVKKNLIGKYDASSFIEKVSKQEISDVYFCKYDNSLDLISGSKRCYDDMNEFKYIDDYISDLEYIKKKLAMTAILEIRLKYLLTFLNMRRLHIYNNIQYMNFKGVSMHQNLKCLSVMYPKLKTFIENYIINLNEIIHYEYLNKITTVSYKDRCNNPDILYYIHFNKNTGLICLCIIITNKHKLFYEPITLDIFKKLNFVLSSNLYGEKFRILYNFDINENALSLFSMYNIINVARTFLDYNDIIPDIFINFIQPTLPIILDKLKTIIYHLTNI